MTIQQILNVLKPLSPEITEEMIHDYWKDEVVRYDGYRIKINDISFNVPRAATELELIDIFSCHSADKQ